MSSSSSLRRGLVVVVFVLGLLGSALILSGHSSLRPLHRFGSLLSRVVFSGNNSSVLIGLDAVVGDPARFHLDPTWNVHAAPTTRTYNWSASLALSGLSGGSRLICLILVLCLSRSCF